MVLAWGLPTLGSSGPPNFHLFSVCAAAAVGGEFVDAAPSQHFGRTASMLGWTRQSSAAAPFTTRPAMPSFTVGGVGRTAALTLSVSGCSDGTCPRFFWDKFHLEHPDHHPQPGSAFLGVGRCAAAPSARTQRPFCPATSRPCADRSPLLPLQVAQWSPPSPTTATAR